LVTLEAIVVRSSPCGVDLATHLMGVPVRQGCVMRHHEEAAAATWAFSEPGVVALVGRVIPIDGRRGATASAGAPFRADLHPVLDVAQNFNGDAAHGDPSSTSNIWSRGAV
jgi:hypothetical protein